MSIVLLTASALACDQQSDSGDASGSAYWHSQKEWEPEDIDALEVVHLDLEPPPFVHEHEQTAPEEPRLNKVRMVISEEEIEVEPGVFIYHCAPEGEMVPWHFVHGMNGAIMVLPRDGIKDPGGNRIEYDRAYYVGEQDFYIP